MIWSLAERTLSVWIPADVRHTSLHVRGRGVFANRDQMHLYITSNEIKKLYIIFRLYVLCIRMNCLLHVSGRDMDQKSF